MAAGSGRRGVSSVSEDGWQRRETFDVQIALPPGIDHDAFADALASHIEFNLAAGLGTTPTHSPAACNTSAPSRRSGIRA